MRPGLQHKRPSAAFFLLSLMLFQGVGWLFAWQGMYWTARWSAHRELTNQPHLERLTLSLAEFQACRIDRREILREGRLYDISSLSFFSDSVRLTVYHDRHEQKLLTHLDKFLAPLHQRPGEQPSVPALWLAQWLGAAYLTPQPPALAFPAIRAERTAFFWLFPAGDRNAPVPFVPPWGGC